MAFPGGHIFLKTRDASRNLLNYIAQFEIFKFIQPAIFWGGNLKLFTCLTIGDIIKVLNKNRKDDQT